MILRTSSVSPHPEKIFSKSIDTCSAARYTLGYGCNSSSNGRDVFRNGFVPCYRRRWRNLRSLSVAPSIGFRVPILFWAAVGKSIGALIGNSKCSPTSANLISFAKKTAGTAARFPVSAATTTMPELPATVVPTSTTRTSTASLSRQINSAGTSAPRSKTHPSAKK